MNGRTKIATVAILGLTAVAIVAIVYNRDAAIIAPFISAVLVIAGYEGVKQVEERTNGN
jgi:hypothetical protein